MKLKLLPALALAAGLLAIGNWQSSTASAQTNAPANFLQQAAAWGTSFDTNKSWATVSLQFEDGLNQTTGTGGSDYVRGQYDISQWNITAEGDFFGVGSAFNAIEGGGGYALVSKYDFKCEANLLLGGTKTSTASGLRFEVEPEIKLTKLMTGNTYSTVSLSLPWVQGQSFNGTPALRVGMGFTF